MQLDYHYNEFGIVFSVGIKSVGCVCKIHKQQEISISDNTVENSLKYLKESFNGVAFPNSIEHNEK